jgi:hypothetical protein
MDKEKFFKIWKDPVWSKLIAGAFIAIITLICNYAIAKLNDVSFLISFEKFWTYKIELWVIILTLILFFLAYNLLKEPFMYDERTLQLDRDLFNQMRQNHSIVDFILEAKSNAFSSRPVKSERITTIFNVIEDSRKPDFHFFNPRLEKLKNKVIEEFGNLDLIMMDNIYGTGNSEFFSIPSEWEFEQPDRMSKAIADIQRQENILATTYEDFITTGRRILKV